MELFAVLRATVSLTVLIGILVAVVTAWVKLDESPAQHAVRIAKEQGECGSGEFECETQLKAFEACTATDPNVAEDVALCDGVVLFPVGEAQAACTDAGNGAQCSYTSEEPLCIPSDLVRNSYYDCIGTVEACTATDAEIEADVKTCAAVVLDGRAVTCTNAGDCTYWGVDVVSDFSDEKGASLSIASVLARSLVWPTLPTAHR
jgi:hypothetical protein